MEPRLQLGQAQSLHGLHAFLVVLHRIPRLWLVRLGERSSASAQAASSSAATFSVRLTSAWMASSRSWSASDRASGEGLIIEGAQAFDVSGRDAVVVAEVEGLLASRVVGDVRLGALSDGHEPCVFEVRRATLVRSGPERRK